MDDSSAPSLPFELWAKIARFLRDGVSSYCDPYEDYNIVQPLSESCRWLRAVVQPILYECVKVDATDYRCVHKAGGLASTLSARPDLRSSVRKLELLHIQAGNDCDALLEVIPLLVEVRFLSITSGAIEEAIVKLLHNARYLHTLHIYNARWGMDVSEKWSEVGSFGVNLTELDVYDTGADLPHHIPRNLQLFVQTVAKLEIDSKMIAALMKSPAPLSFGSSLVRLVALANHPITHTPLRQLLSQCPNLEDLDMKGLCRVSSIDEEFLPKLRSINADISLVTAVLPGRPIRSVTTTAAPKLFKNPLPQLAELKLIGLSEWRQGRKIIKALLVACPGLIRLELTTLKREDVFHKWMETRLISSLAALPRLQVLHSKDVLDNFYSVEPLQYPLTEVM